MKKVTNTRIYFVTARHEVGGDIFQRRLIRATTASQAIRFVAAPMIQAVVPTQEELVAAGKGGAEIEDAS